MLSRILHQIIFTSRLAKENPLPENRFSFSLTFWDQETIFSSFKQLPLQQLQIMGRALNGIFFPCDWITAISDWTQLRTTILLSICRILLSNVRNLSILQLQISRRYCQYNKLLSEILLVMSLCFVGKTCKILKPKPVTIE